MKVNINKKEMAAINRVLNVLQKKSYNNKITKSESEILLDLSTLQEKITNAKLREIELKRERTFNHESIIGV